MPDASPLQSHGAVESKALETYGSGDNILRIGNGGAGATGLIKRLATDYLSTRSNPAAIEWICNHSRNTLLALYHGYIDLALTYERDQEALAISQGWAKSAGCAFHDHFCLAGPIDDPHGLSSCASLTDAFRQIARGEHPFHTRNDYSATMFKERSIWTAADIHPWEYDTSQWYKAYTISPAEALIQADRDGAYLLTDRSTLLRQTSLGNLSDKTTVFFEPKDAENVLMNSCYALYNSQAEAKTAAEVQDFLEYLRSDRGQQVIATFGKEEAGLPFFASTRDGFASPSLIGRKAVGSTFSGRDDVR